MTFSLQKHQFWNIMLCGKVWQNSPRQESSKHTLNIFCKALEYSKCVRHVTACGKVWRRVAKCGTQCLPSVAGMPLWQSVAICLDPLQQLTSLPPGNNFELAVKDMLISDVSPVGAYVPRFGKLGRVQISKNL